MGDTGLLVNHFETVAHSLLQALLNSFWQGMIIAALVWILLRVIKRASATTRHALWLVSLLTIGILPLITIISIRRGAAPTGSTPDPVKQEQRQEQWQEQGMAAIQPAEPVAFPESLPPLVENRIARLNSSFGTGRSTVSTEYNRAARIEDLPRAEVVDGASRVVLKTVAETGHATAVTNSKAGQRVLWEKIRSRGIDLLTGRVSLILICLWLVACVLMIGRIVRSYLSLFKMLRRLGGVPSEQRRRVEHLAQIFGIKRRVSIFTSRKVSMPMTVGSFRPIIILPPDLARNLSAAEFESIIAHELAHIKRWDYLTNFLQRLVQSYLFFHPAVWLIGKQLMIERELACDDWAVKTCEPYRYASCLTKLVELLSEGKPLVTATGILFGKHVISRRVEMILNRDRNTTTAVSKPALMYTIGLAVVFISMCVLISPVIALPLAQGRDQKQSKKQEKAAPPAPVKPADVAPVKTPEPPEAIEIPVPVAAPTAAETPEPPEPPAIIGSDDRLTPAPRARAVGGIAGGIAVDPIDAFDLTPEPTPIAQPATARAISPRPAPMAIPAVAAGWDQDDKNKPSVISETELLGVLSDVVKNDADPAVRNEALQGICRMRSDAAINSLMQLYDGVSDVKVKGEIIGYLLRRNGDNTKAIAKLMTIAKSESNEDLKGRAVRSLASIKGDDGAVNLIQIYDGLQDSKMKQLVVRCLASNKSRKAVDKLIQIAKNDTDPTIRQAAIRSLYGIDERLYLEFADKNRPRISMLDKEWPLYAPSVVEWNSKMTEEMKKRFEEQQERWRELMEKMQIKGLDNLWIEIPKIELRLKELEENQNLNLDRKKASELEKQMQLRLAEAQTQLQNLNSQYAQHHPKVVEIRNLQNALQRQIEKVHSFQNDKVKAPVIRRAVSTPKAATAVQSSSLR